MTSPKQWTVEELAAEVAKGNSDQLLEGLDWFWREQNYMARYPDFVEVLAAASRASERVRAHFVALRDAVAPKADDQRAGLVQWLVLNDALGNEAQTLAWFDDRVARGAVLVVPMSRLRARLLERGRAGDLLALMESPLEQVEDIFWVQSNSPARSLDERLRAHMDSKDRLELALILRATEAGRPDQADAVRAAILAGDNTAEMREMLELSFERLRDMELA